MPDKFLSNKTEKGCLDIFVKHATGFMTVKDC